MDSTNNDSFEKLRNQFVPMNQRWFSSDRARPSFRAGTVRPKRQTSVQRVAALKCHYARILANFRSVVEVWSSRAICTTSPQLGHT